MSKDLELEELLKAELLRYANRHIPYTRKSLNKLLSEDFPHVICRDGTKHYFHRRELEYLASLLPKSLWGRLKLPIVIVLSPELGEGAAVINGGLECYIVCRVLGIKYEGQENMIIYRPQVVELRRKLRTTTQYALSLKSLIESNEKLEARL